MLEKMYLDYLKMIGLDPKKMHKIQNQEMRRSFMAGIGSFIANISDKRSKADILKTMDNATHELSEFWAKQK